MPWCFVWPAIMSIFYVSTGLLRMKDQVMKNLLNVYSKVQSSTSNPVLDGSPAVYMSYMSQNFCLIRVSNLSVLNFRIFLLMYPESSETRRVAATNKVPGTGDWLTVGRKGLGGRHWKLCCPAAHWAVAAQHNIQCWTRRRSYGKTVARSKIWTRDLAMTEGRGPKNANSSARSCAKTRSNLGSRSTPVDRAAIGL